MRTPSLLVASTLVVVACGSGDGGGGQQARFCAEVEAHTTELVTAPADVAGIDAFVERYRDIGRSAPLAIEPHWDALVLNYETASTVQPADPESVQRAVGRAYATERSAIAVKDWVQANCGVDLGAVATVTGAVPTAAPPPTSAPTG